MLCSHQSVAQHLTSWAPCGLPHRITTPDTRLFKCRLSPLMNCHFASAAKVRFPPFVPLVTSGPLLPFTSTSECCSVALHCGHSYILQHFGGSNVGLRCGFNRSLGLLQRLLCITNVVRALPSVFPFSLSNKMCRCLWYVPIMKVWKILSWDDCIAQRLSKSSAKS